MLVQGRFPKTRGVRVGTVVGKTGRGVIVALAGADLVFDEGHPEQDEQGGRVYASNDPAEQRPGERGASAPCSSQQGADTPPLAQQK
jgi:putative protease